MSFPRYPKYKDSGVEWLGEVPEHWEIERFRHQFRESPEKIEDTVVGPMLSVSGYRGIEVKEYDDENRRRSDEDLVGYRIVRPGQLVVNTMWLNYAGLGVSEYEGHVSPAYRAYAFSGELEGRFAHHLLRSAAYVQGYTQLLTGVRPNSLQMSRDDLMSFPVIVPPRGDQIQIAAFLDRETAKIDELVAEQQRLMELLKEKRKAVISHAVTKGLNPDAPRKPSGVEWLGEVPAHWEVGRLKRYWSVTDCKHVTAEFVEDGIPLASIREVQGHWVDLSRAKQTTEHFFEILSEGSRLPEVGDLIFSRNATVGEVAQVGPQHPRFAMGQDVVLLRKLLPDYSSDYLQQVIRSPAIERQLENVMIGSTFKRVNVEEICSFMVPMPPPSEQSSISGHLSEATAQFAELETAAQGAITLLTERRAAMISAAVTGQIDVRSLVAA